MSASRLLWAAFVLPVFFSFAFAEDIPAPKKVTPDSEDPSIQRMKKDIFFLAGDECEGRGVKTKGLIKAGEHIAASFKESGLKPGGKDNTYFQPFTIGGGGKVQPGATFTLLGPDDKKLELALGKEYQPTNASKTGKLSSGIIFAGYGIKAPDQKYDDFDGIDVKGKFIIVLRRTPRADDKKEPFDKNNTYAPLVAKVFAAQERGAAGLIFVSDLGTAGEKDELMEEGRAAGGLLDGAVVHVKRSIVDKLLEGMDKKLADIEKEIDKTGKPQSFEVKGWKAESNLEVKRIEYNTRNVIGVLEGAGPLKDETIVIGAHYDHLGKGDEGSSLDDKPNGKIHYGADDNASGTTGVLELARRFGAMKDRQGRRMVFITFSGEERGLLGSAHYVKSPMFPLDKTVFMLNMDMIGRMIEEKDKDGKFRDRLLIYGTGTSEGMEKLVEETMKPYDLKLLKFEGGIGPSDHTSFYAKKIPVLFFFTGTHMDYHKATDTPDQINLKGMKQVADIAEKFAKHFTTVDKAPVYRATKGGSEDPTNPRMAFSKLPRLGIMPGNYGEQDGGVLVQAITKDGAADKAGMKKDDRIVEINGKSVKRMEGGSESFMAVMSEQKAGVEIPIVVIRDDKKITVKVTPNPPPTK